MEIKKLNFTNIAIDETIFEIGFQKNTSPLQCTGSCCKSGVFLSFDEKDKIIEMTEAIKQYMDDSQTKDESIWFENKIIEDSDFADGQCDSTNIHNNKCVFLNKKGLCVLQMMAVDNGHHKWTYKPFYCIAFPIVLENGAITYDDYLLDVEPCCTAKKGLPENFIDACKEEFLYILGEEVTQS